MDVEKFISEEQKLSKSTTPEVINVKLSSRVDMNHLLARVRKEEKKESNINMVFFGLFALLILVVGFLLSL